MGCNSSKTKTEPPRIGLEDAVSSYGNKVKNRIDQATMYKIDYNTLALIFGYLDDPSDFVVLAIEDGYEVLVGVCSSITEGNSIYATLLQVRDEFYSVEDYNKAVPQWFKEEIDRGGKIISRLYEINGIRYGNLKFKGRRYCCRYGAAFDFDSWKEFDKKYVGGLNRWYHTCEYITKEADFWFSISKEPRGWVKELYPRSLFDS